MILRLGWGVAALLAPTSSVSHCSLVGSGALMWS
jgi:hypothetical protein